MSAPTTFAELIERTAIGLLQQGQRGGVRSEHGPDNFRCMLRAGNLRCAVGIHIVDGEYAVELEELDPISMLSMTRRGRYSLRESFGPLLDTTNIGDILMVMQEAHDLTLNWRSPAVLGDVYLQIAADYVAPDQLEQLTRSIRSAAEAAGGDRWTR